MAGRHFAPPRRRNVFVVNGAANLVRAASGSLENLLIPLILLWLLPKDEYGVWALVFSTSTYVTYLDLGLQTSVQTNVARSAGAGDPVGAAKMAASGVKMALGVGVFALVSLILAAGYLGHIFPGIPSELVTQAQQALVILTVGQIANLSINVLSAYYAGLQRSVFPSLVMAIARTVSLLLVVIAGTTQKLLPLLSAAYSAPLVLGFLLLVFAFLRESRHLSDVHGKSPVIPLSGSRYGHLLRYSGPLMVWNVCTLVVNAAGVAIVGRIDFSSVAVYSISTMFVLAIVGVDNAVMSPLLSDLGRQAASSNRSGLRETSISASRINSVILSALLCFSWAVLTFFVTNWHQSEDKIQVAAVAVLLTLAASTRLTMTPLTFGFVATGGHRRVLIQPVIDALLNMAMSIGLGVVFGVLGVALGAVLSGVASVVLAVSWSRNAAGFGRIVSAPEMYRSIGLPMLLAGPTLGATLLLPSFSELGSSITMAVVGVAAAASLSMIWGLSVPAPIKRFVVNALQKRSRG